MLNRIIVPFVIVFSFTGCCSKKIVRTEPLNDMLWNESKWISVKDAPVISGQIMTKVNNRSADGSSWFVAFPQNEKEVVSAIWMTTGLGIYSLYVNGNPIGEEVLKPGFTHNKKTKYSFTYDITKIFKCKEGGINRLSAQLTPGWWGDKIVTPWGHLGMIGHKTAFRAVLQLTYDDGSTFVFGTDTISWKAGIAGPVKHAAIFDGEEYDAREHLGDLLMEKLTTPEINSEFEGTIFPSNGAEIFLRKDLSLIPIDIYVWRDILHKKKEFYGKVVKLREYKHSESIKLAKGETLVVDFGQNAAAVPLFVFKAKKGTVLTCLPGEMLNDGVGAYKRGMDGPEGSVYRSNLGSPDNAFRIIYTFGDSDKFVSYYPKCTYFGYRYISITATDEVTFKSIYSIPITSIAKSFETGFITTGNVWVNKLITNTIWSMRSNYLSIPTDCPQRNERLGWTADAQIFANTGTFFANTKTFFHKYMRDLRDSQSPTGSFPGVAPDAQYGNGMMRFGWADAGIIIPWTIWKQYGDCSIINENWDAMEKFMMHVNETKYDHLALINENGNYQWADWLSYEPLETNSGKYSFVDEGKNKMVSAEAVEYWGYLGACYWAIDAEMMYDMAVATKRDATKYKSMWQNAIYYLKSKYLNDDGTFKVDILNTMQTPAIFALKTNLVEGTQKKTLVARLRKNFAEHNNCLQTGFLGTSILMPVLTENGMSDIAYNLLFQRKNPSWLYSIDNGATTIWERWNSYTHENGICQNSMNSFNHYAYGVVCAWLWEYVAGIATDPSSTGAGFKHIIMKPIPDRRLGYLNAEYKSEAGIIKSSWKYVGNKWLWEFTIPDGCMASVMLPGETVSKTYTAGTWKVSKEID